MLIGHFQYRPEIDGLRAIAVLSVILFHAGFGLFKGGYVGVDVFFVISGYLITSLILRDIESGNFSVKGFWERRIRRILPAAFAMVITTLIGGWFLLLPSDFADLARSALYQAFFGANFYFRECSHYFGGPSEELPLLHTWSLAVEEQFYLLFPFGLVLLCRVPRFRGRNALTGVLVTMTLVSLLISIWALPRKPVATFYLLPTRAWELFVGAVVAVLPMLKRPANSVLLAVAGLIGLVMIAATVLFYNRETPFPGLAALPPCFGAALFIWASRTGEGTGQMTLAGRFLSVSPIVFVGLISYSLYLWHWPFFAVHRYFFSTSPDLLTGFLYLLAALSLAAGSYFAIERPVRQRRMVRTKAGAFLVGAACIALVAVPAKVIDHYDGFPQRMPREVLSLAAAKNDFVFCGDLSAGDVPERLVRAGAQGSSPKVLVWGDSHATAIIPCLDHVCRELGICAVGATHCSTAPVLDWYVPGTPYGLNEESPEFNRRVLAFAESAASKEESFLVVLVARWSGYLDGVTRKEGLQDSLLRTVGRLVQAGCRVVVMKEVPSFSQNVPKALALAALSGSKSVEPQLSVKEHLIRVSAAEALINEIKERCSGVTIIDPLDLLPVHGGTIFAQDENGVPLLMDNNHLTRSGSLRLAPAFRSVLTGLTVNADSVMP